MTEIHEGEINLIVDCTDPTDCHYNIGEYID